MNGKGEIPVLVIKDIGSASGLTRGLAFTTPWIENAQPPFHCYCVTGSATDSAEGSSQQKTEDGKRAVIKAESMIEAARWFVDLITAADLNQLWPQFEEWLSQDSDNRSAYEEMERTWSEVYLARVARAPKTVAWCDPETVLH